MAYKCKTCKAKFRSRLALTWHKQYAQCWKEMVRSLFASN